MSTHYKNRQPSGCICGAMLFLLMTTIATAIGYASHELGSLIARRL